MPLYDYACDGCGPFRAWASMADADEAASCPCCSALGVRQMAVPQLSLINTKLRRALDRAERTKDEPRIVSRKHLDGCGCSICAARRASPSVARRWMIGH